MYHFNAEAGASPFRKKYGTGNVQFCYKFSNILLKMKSYGLKMREYHASMSNATHQNAWKRSQLHNFSNGGPVCHSHKISCISTTKIDLATIFVDKFGFGSWCVNRVST
jgi:hypothetical protein